MRICIASILAVLAACGADEGARAKSAGDPPLPRVSGIGVPFQYISTFTREVTVAGVLRKNRSKANEGEPDIWVQEVNGEILQDSRLMLVIPPDPWEWEDKSHLGVADPVDGEPLRLRVGASYELVGHVEAELQGVDQTGVPLNEIISASSRGYYEHLVVSKLTKIQPLTSAPAVPSE